MVEGVVPWIMGAIKLGVECLDVRCSALAFGMQCLGFAGARTFVWGVQCSGVGWSPWYPEGQSLRVKASSYGFIQFIDD